MKRFRIKESDTIKAKAFSGKTKKLLASIYDSGFTSIVGVEVALLRKILNFGGGEIEVHITNIDKDEQKYTTIKMY